jgi:hypothetical protein
VQEIEAALPGFESAVPRTRRKSAA